MRCLCALTSLLSSTPYCIGIREPSWLYNVFETHWIVANWLIWSAECKPKFIEALHKIKRVRIKLAWMNYTLENEWWMTNQQWIHWMANSLLMPLLYSNYSQHIMHKLLFFHEQAINKG